MAKQSPHNFSRLSPEERRGIAQKGGRASQSSGNGRRWTPEEAAEAGRKGGFATAKKRREYHGRVGGITEASEEELREEETT